MSFLFSIVPWSVDFFVASLSGTEGRAGMAAIVDEQHSLDLKELNHNMQRSLPSYARPVFIRLLAKLDMTGDEVFKKTSQGLIGIEEKTQWTVVIDCSLPCFSGLMVDV